MRLLVFLFIPYLLQAQDDQVVASQLYDLVSFAGNINKINDPAKLDCFTPMAEIEVKTEMTCVAEDDPQEEIKPENYQTFTVDVDKHKDLPEEIKQHVPGQAFEQGKGGIKVVLALPNDNKALGLWGVIAGEDGNDFGDTHGSKISLSTTDHNLNRFTLNGETNLYTKQLSGSYIKDNQKYYDQNFTNETMVRFIYDNMLKNKTTYYKAGVGWIKLDSEKSKGFFRASGQQNSWHGLLDIYQLNNVADGKGIRNGVNLDAFFGVQKNLMLGSSCRVRTFAETGGNISTLSDDYFKVGAGAMLYFQKPNKKSTFSLGADGDLKVHNKGTQKEMNFTAGWNSNRLGAKFIYTQRYTALRNHVNYNLPNANGKVEPTMTIALTYNIDGIKVFGKNKKANKKK